MRQHFNQYIGNRSGRHAQENQIAIAADVLDGVCRHDARGKVDQIAKIKRVAMIEIDVINLVLLTSIENYFVTIIGQNLR
jgi:hypothetical protein